MHHLAKSPRVISEVIDGEAIIIDMNTGNYFSSLGVGARIWEFASNGADVDTVLQAVSSAFPEEPNARSATRDFLNRLLEFRLLVAVETQESPTQVMSLSDLQYSVPTIEVHDDMSDLILLDPIHDTDSAGWPIRPKLV